MVCVFCTSVRGDKRRVETLSIEILLHPFQPVRIDIEYRDLGVLSEQFEQFEQVAGLATGRSTGIEYPLSRYLYMYVNKKPGTPLSPLETEFLKQ